LRAFAAAAPALLAAALLASSGCLLDCANRPGRSLALEAPGLYEALTDRPAPPPDGTDPLPPVPGLGHGLPAADAFVKEILWQAPSGVKLRMIPPFPPYQGNLSASVWVQSGALDAGTAAAFLADLLPAGRSDADSLARDFARLSRIPVPQPFDLRLLLARHAAADNLTRMEERWEYGANFSAVWMQHLDGGWTVWWALRDHSLGGEDHGLRYRIRVDPFGTGTATAATADGSRTADPGDALVRDVVLRALAPRMDTSRLRLGAVSRECYVNLQ